MNRFVYRLLEEKDTTQIIKFIEKIKPPILGLKTKEIYHKLCHYVHRTDRVVFCIALLSDRIVGFSITTIDYYRFWIEFLIHNPAILVEVIKNKIIEEFKPVRFSKMQNVNMDISPYLSQNTNNRSWRDSSSSIAKVLYIAVDKEFRKQGIASGLYKFRHNVLKNLGVKRIDGKINQQNFVPIKLAHSERRTIIKEKNGMLFTTFDL